MALSNRGRDAVTASSSTFIWEVLKNLWDPENNASGFVSLAMAENTLMHSRLLPRLLAGVQLTEDMLTYHDGTTGTNHLKLVLSKFLTTHLHLTDAIDPNDITVTNGCCSAIEQLAWALADPDEAFLVGRPYFRAFLTTLGSRMHVNTAPVTFADVDPFGSDAAERYEASLLEAQAKGQRIRGIILCNPHNPTGRCYPRNTIVQLMQLCQKYHIHLISDEIYALSVWGPGEQFHSCLSIDITDLIDRSLVHVVWGTSKDFGINGLRVGAVISQHSPELHKAIAHTSIHSSPSSLAEAAIADILDDQKWTEQYITDNKARLAKRYSLIEEWARSHRISVAPGINAAFFIWLDLGTAFREEHPDLAPEAASMALDKALMDQKVLLASGESFGSEQPGWFRIVYSLPIHELDEGLRRIDAALNA
ncbi:ACC synthase [Paramyrothecium foliicola]|nr:ACC synthase [Paramyrothecium foliicola]